MSNCNALVQSDPSNYHSHASTPRFEVIKKILRDTITIIVSMYVCPPCASADDV